MLRFAAGIGRRSAGFGGSGIRRTSESRHTERRHEVPDGPDHDQSCTGRSAQGRQRVRPGHRCGHSVR